MQTKSESQKRFSYSHHPLDLDTDQIRLLKVHYTKWDEPVRCSMHVVSLEAFQQQDEYVYLALSYVWGDPEPTHTVYVDGLPLSVRSNLFDALRRLRLKFPYWPEHDLIWIDAMCIDQSSLEERSRQVAMMSRIYKSCAKVIVWLGDIDRETPPAVEIFTPDEQYIPPAQMVAFPYFMKYLLHNSWFTRIWVVQEFVLPPQVSLCIGSAILPVELLYNATAVFYSHVRSACCLKNILKRVRFTPVFGNVASLRHIRKAVASNSDLDYFVLRHALAGRKASLDHDLLYGILGLNPLQTDDLVLPDYDRPVTETYIEFSSKYVSSRSGCDFNKFAAFTHAPLKSRYPDLPSWVIDHTLYEDDNLFEFLPEATGLMASFARSHATKHGASHSLKIRGHHLILHGHFIDSIDIIGQVNLDRRFAYKSLHDDRRYRVLDDWRETVSARHASDEPYVLPDEYASLTDTWQIAWLKTMSWAHRTGVEGGPIRLTDEEVASLMKDATLDPSSPCNLDSTPSFCGRWSDEYTAETYGQMDRVDLYIQYVSMLVRALYRTRMFLTHSHFLGIGNPNIQPGDRVFLSAGCGRPLILRPVETNLQRNGQITYKIVSSCYLHGFMDGPDQGTEFPCKEVWIE
ncbi:heterokaryon incompatibility protein-domain-containing protein [Boeremia exigua]|uniref:heterokaryon incompatibility protein-domain-containing protein n=1 Tax=Boeremia exigua TaxID=749465 RepID=UPI001E8EBCFB|nr:heterokaryon incompatibility protein-domain-containing protein [Boeremia exigua]KAH6619018.1 heterokaryon incompatibility protein-domain-containing protein [Boeremia exigua]